MLATFLVDGYAAGLWTTERKKRTATLALKPFAPLTKTAAGDLAVEGEKLLRFVEEDADTYAIQIVD